MPHDTDNARVVNLPAAADVTLHRNPRLGWPSGGKEPTLRDIGQSLFEGRWVIAIVAGAALAISVGYLFAAPPWYRSSALIQVEDQSNTAAELENLSALFEKKTLAEGEIEIIRSRMVVGAVVDRIKLDIEAEPRRVPIVGSVLARRHRGLTPAPPILGLSRFAWGGERIALRRLEVSNGLLDKPLSLTALEGGRYRLTDVGGASILEGEVGMPASMAAGGRQVELFVSELVARPGTEFRIVKHRRDEVIDAVQADLRVEEKGKSTGIITIDLEGRDPARAAAIVSALSWSYLQQNVERSRAKAAKTLEFVESQLPTLKSNLEAAEAALNAFRLKKGTVNLSLETRATIHRLAELEKGLTELDMQRAELERRYTDKHPSLAWLDSKAAVVRAERSALNERIRALPETQLTAARLVRDVNVATDLYLLLLNKAEALRVMKSGTIGNVRIVDQPVIARHPVRPKPASVLVLGLVLGFGGGIAGAIARRALDEGADDSHDIEAGTGLPVFATVPHSEKEVQLQRRAGRDARVPLAVAVPDDVAIENLRTLRTALGFVLKARGNIIAISSPSPGVGKTFVCANLAHLLAGAEQRVLLLDADLRRGALHRYFSAERQPGLSEVVSGDATLEQAIRSTGSAGLDLLPCGGVSPNPAELLASPRLQQILTAASQRYDLLLVDTPPTLAVTDPVLVARCASLNLLVLRARQHPIAEISLALGRFAQGGVRVQGAVLNDARSTSGRYGRVYEHRSGPR
jgi:tyrosine-protein kinase Etk/Wzc